MFSYWKWPIVHMYGFLQDDNFSVYKYIKLDRYIYHLTCSVCHSVVYVCDMYTICVERRRLSQYYTRLYTMICCDFMIVNAVCANDVAYWLFKQCDDAPYGYLHDFCYHFEFPFWHNINTRMKHWMIVFDCNMNYK